MVKETKIVEENKKEKVRALRDQVARALQWFRDLFCATAAVS